MCIGKDMHTSWTVWSWGWSAWLELPTPSWENPEDLGAVPGVGGVWRVQAAQPEYLVTLGLQFLLDIVVYCTIESAELPELLFHPGN